MADAAVVILGGALTTHTHSFRCDWRRARLAYDHGVGFAEVCVEPEAASGAVSTVRFAAADVVYVAKCGSGLYIYTRGTPGPVDEIFIFNDLHMTEAQWAELGHALLGACAHLCSDTPITGHIFNLKAVAFRGRSPNVVG